MPFGSSLYKLMSQALSVQSTGSTPEEKDGSERWRLWSAPPIKIIVGSNRKIFWAHPKALTRASPVLEARLCGPWANDEREIDWTCFDESTVQHVLDWCYAEDYVAGQDDLPFSDAEMDQTPGLQQVMRYATDESEVGISMEEDEYPLDEELHDADDYSNTGRVIESRETVAANLNGSVGYIFNREDLQAPTDLPPMAVTTAAGRLRVHLAFHRDHHSQSQSLAAGPLIVAHAKVYGFACEYLIPELAHAALQRLNQATVMFDVAPPERESYLAEAVREVYEKTSSSPTEMDPARRTLVRYAVVHFESIGTTQFIAAAAECPEFMADVHRLMGVRRKVHDLRVRMRENQARRAEHKAWRRNF